MKNAFKLAQIAFKSFAFTVAILVALLAVGVGVAVAAPSSGPIAIETIQKWYKAGLYVGPASTADTLNKTTRLLAGTETFSFTSQTITCQDSTGITVTGAQVGDGCEVGTPAAPTANANFSCYVSAANTVKGRFCPAGTAAVPGSTTLRYYLRSNQ